MKLKTFFAATVLAASTTLSFASGPFTLSPDPVNPNTFTSVVTQTSSAEIFTDTFDFAALTSSADVVFALFNVIRPAQFFVANVTSGSSSKSFSFFPEDGPLSPVSFHTSIDANTPFTLTVLGSGVPVGGAPFATGLLTYGVAVVAAVPEPETYALMLLGLIGVGGMARRQQRAATLSIA